MHNGIVPVTDAEQHPVSDINPIDVWLRIPDDEDEAEAEANTFRTTDGYRVDWSLTAVGLIKSRWFDDYEKVQEWLTAEGFSDFSS